MCVNGNAPPGRLVPNILKRGPLGNQERPPNRDGGRRRPPSERGPSSRRVLSTGLWHENGEDDNTQGTLKVTGGRRPTFVVEMGARPPRTEQSEIPETPVPVPAPPPATVWDPPRPTQSASRQLLSEPSAPVRVFLIRAADNGLIREHHLPPLPP